MNFGSYNPINEIPATDTRFYNDQAFGMTFMSYSNRKKRGLLSFEGS